MPNNEAHVSPLSKYALQGRIVTMGDLGVLTNGVVYVEGGVIADVREAGALPPLGFAGIPIIDTGGTIYPGLIELHNHLCYNAMPLWNVPRRFTNNGQWRNHQDYARFITKPSQVLAGTPDLAVALIRYVECRCLLGGVTTSQGITLSSQPGIGQFYEGLVRNVERPSANHPDLPRSRTRIGNPDTGKASQYLTTLLSQPGQPYLQHLSEGVDDTARRWFLRLKLENGDWAITDDFCGIHSSALNADDFAVICEHGGSMIWSPLSNYLLYGDTVDLRAARDSGILIGLGSDWSPSGSKNLLGEMKVAWLAGQKLDGSIVARDILEMATIDAARIAKWDHALGSLAPGKLADLMVLEGRHPGAYKSAIEADETDVVLVVIDGVPRVGMPALMGALGLEALQLERFQVGGADRDLYLHQPTAHEKMQGLSLGEAIDRLQEAMADLPNRAKALDNAATATTGGTTAHGARAAPAPWLTVALDFDALDLATTAAGAGKPYTDYVTEPMALPTITVVDDPDYLPDLAAARNLPEFVKKGLPSLYHQAIPLPAAADFLRRRPAEEQPVRVMATTQTLETFLRTWGELTLEERRTIVDQAQILLEANYVHLPFKKAMHGIDPVQRLRLLRYRMQGPEDDTVRAELEFHSELARIFNSLRDLHTVYRLPYPYRGKVAWLPFTVEVCWEHGHPKYLVTKIVGNPGPDDFEPGVELLYWNGAPIERAVAQNAERQGGGNPAAAEARGLNALTIRPLSHGLPPDESWVTLHYQAGDGPIKEWTQHWLVFEPERAPRSVDPEAEDALAAALGLDPLTDEIQETKRVLYAGKVAIQEERAYEEDRELRTPIKDAASTYETFLPTVFRANEVPYQGRDFGYIRIFTFNVANADAFVDEFVRLVGLLPQDGLIIDVRANGGGLIYAAERLLQVLTDKRPIEPMKAQFICTELNLRICKRHVDGQGLPGLDLQDWINSIKGSVETGATYSRAFPITDDDSCNEREQTYPGPVLLITDALSYSATDMFAAGFQDHGIGPILGVGKSTGAGGANVWSHALLQTLMGGSGVSPYVPLPGGADLRVAIRRTLRVGPSAGVVLEDYGVEPDEPYRMTRRDLMCHNSDLLEYAAALLSGPSGGTP